MDTSLRIAALLFGKFTGSLAFSLPRASSWDSTIGVYGTDSRKEHYYLKRNSDVPRYCGF